MNMNMEAKDILMVLKKVPTPTYTLPHLTVEVVNGFSEESHVITTQDSMVDLMFDLSMYGGMIIDLSYNVRFHELTGLSIDLYIRIGKTMRGNTNIDADVIEELSRIMSRGEKI